VTRHDGVATSTREEATLRMGKGGDDASCVDANLIESKNEENARGRFTCYKWTVKI
jgi:hypothetical protein